MNIKALFPLLEGENFKSCSRSCVGQEHKQEAAARQSHKDERKLGEKRKGKEAGHGDAPSDGLH